MAIILDWKIRATQARCELTEAPFVDGQEFYTCIFDDPESDGFIRRDYAVESWEKIRNEIDPAPFSFWKSTYKAPVQEEDRKRIDDHSVEGMLRRFIEEDDPKTENARYILALMMERKKTLIPTDIQEAETRKLLFYEHADTGDVFVVADPQLKLDEIEEVQLEVAELLAEEERGAAGQDKETDETNEEAEAAADSGELPETETGDSSGKSESPSLEHSGEEASEEEKDNPDHEGEKAPESE